MDKNPDDNPRVIPVMSINLMSAPPKLSFLNKKFPKSIIKYIKINRITPDKMYSLAFNKPNDTISNAAKIVANEYVISSGIIIYLISDIDTITKSDDISIALIKLMDKPNFI